MFAQSHLRFMLSEASTPQRADHGFERPLATNAVW